MRRRRVRARVDRDDRQQHGDTDGGTDLTGRVDERAREPLLVVRDARARGDRRSEHDIRRAEPEDE